MASTSSEALKAKKVLKKAENGSLREFQRAARQLAQYKGEDIAEAIASVCDENGNGPLHYAAAAGNLQICRYLIDKLNFDPNLSTHAGQTPIMQAAERGYLSTVMYLIGKGANIHEKGAIGFNAVHHAVLEAKHKVLKELVARGGAVDAEHLTAAPLLLAAYYGDASSMKILLECNADPNISCEFISPLVLAVNNNSKQCVEVLKAKLDLSRISLLEWAIDSEEMTLYLFNNGANPNLANELGQLPLEIAAAKGKVEIVNILFPLTTAGPEWKSIEALLCYVKEEHCKKERQELSKRRIESLGKEIKNALHRREYFGASVLSDFASKEDPTDFIAEKIKTLCWRRLSSALLATGIITVNSPAHCPCSNDMDPYSMTDSAIEEALFALNEGQLSASMPRKMLDTLEIFYSTIVQQ